MTTPLSDLPFASTAEVIHAKSWIPICVGATAGYNSDAKNDFDRRVYLEQLFSAQSAVVSALTDIVVVGALVVVDSAGSADYTTTQAAVTALQAKLDAVIVRMNLIQNQWE